MSDDERGGIAEGAGAFRPLIQAQHLLRAFRPGSSPAGGAAWGPFKCLAMPKPVNSNLALQIIDLTPILLDAILFNPDLLVVVPYSLALLALNP